MRAGSAQYLEVFRRENSRLVCGRGCLGSRGRAPKTEPRGPRMTKKKTTAKSAAGKGKGMSQAEFGRHVDLSQQRIAQMIASGVIPQLPNGRIDPSAGR